MRSSRRLIALSCAALLGLGAAPRAAAADDGAKVFAESCSPCHSAAVRPLDNVHLTRDRWKETVERMIDQGAEVPKRKIPELLDYLVRTRGPAGDAPGGK